MDIDDEMDNVPSSGEEDNIDDRKHNQLLDAISSLDGKKRSKLSQRTVISNQISEFNFTSSKDESSRVKLHELVGSLKESISHGDLKKQLRDIEKNKETVSTPLPKHEKEKLDRSTAYETTTKDISKWDPIVMKNRKAEQTEFPLQKQDFRIATTDQFVKRFQPRTPLELEVAALLRGSDNVIHDKHKELTVAEQRALKAMDLDEAKLRRMELMKHRALLSYKEAKAKRQKKIKSKRYHRILKKEKIKLEKKLMDKMKEEDPEGFIDKLNQLEKDRAEERMSLKHRGGSKFAKKQAIYAKYDDRARQEVQDMLQKSRELTKKVDVESDSDNEEMYPDTGVTDDVDKAEFTSPKSSNNPWMAKPSRHGVKSSNDGCDVNDDSDGGENEASEYSRPLEFKSEEIDEERDTGSDNDGEENVEDDNSENVSEKLDDGNSLRNKKKMEVHDLSSISEDIDKKQKPDIDVLKISDIMDDIFKNKVSRKRSDDRQAVGKKKTKMRHRKLKTLQKKEKIMNKSQTKLNTKEVKGVNNTAEDDADEGSDFENTNNESLKRKQTLEDLENDSDDDDKDRNKKVVPVKRQKLNANKKKVKNTSKERSIANKEDAFVVEKEAFVDPKKLFTLETRLSQPGSGPTIVDNEYEDNDMNADEQQRMTIAQAFADDDVIQEFTKEKREVVEKGKPKDIDLTLPGWGSWIGESLKVSRKKRKRFTIKAPPPLPRKDEHLGHVIINESKNSAVTKHQVHEIPFPYVSAQQFEKSIRAPLGKTWNPESVLRDLTKPKVVTKLGKVITPIDKSEAFKHQKNESKQVIDEDTDKDKSSVKSKKFGKHSGGKKSGKGFNKKKLKKNSKKKTKK